MTTREPQSAADYYEERATAALKSVLIEIVQILGSYKGKFTAIGGAAPWLLLNNDNMPHVGTHDIDLDLDSPAPGDDEYASGEGQGSHAPVNLISTEQTINGQC